jgi:tRNA (cmo5U34)-methyltransferase
VVVKAEVERWNFDADVADLFDDMLARSIPQYDTMRTLTRDLTLAYALADSWIVDLGCSRGTTLQSIIKERGPLNKYLGVEVSAPMLTAARERLHSYIEAGYVEVRDMDLREYFPSVGASVTLSVLTLQFVPIEYRQEIVRNVYDNLLPGGAFILVEKILASGARLDALMVKQYLALKARNGYTHEEIERKRMSLEGVLVPITAQWNESLLRNAGFVDIDCFWRWLNFAGWIAIKR